MDAQSPHPRGRRPGARRPAGRPIAGTAVGVAASPASSIARAGRLHRPPRPQRPPSHARSPDGAPGRSKGSAKVCTPAPRTKALVCHVAVVERPLRRRRISSRSSRPYDNPSYATLPAKELATTQRQVVAKIDEHTITCGGFHAGLSTRPHAQRLDVQSQA